MIKQLIRKMDWLIKAWMDKIDKRGLIIYCIYDGDVCPYECSGRCHYSERTCFMREDEEQRRIVK